MAAGGYTPADHQEGGRLLLAPCAYGTSGLDPARDAEARDAQLEAAEWMKTHFKRLRAAVERLHPEETKLFDGLDTSDDTQALVALSLLIERARALPAEAEPVRETLAQRAFGEPERAKLERLIRLAQLEPPPNGDGNAWTYDPREAELVALYRWYADWAFTAKAYIRRKDYLIALGLVGRKTRRADASENDDQGEEA